MPDITNPIDDNTLFILLALKYAGCIEIPNVNAVYDWNVNYDETAVVSDKVPSNIKDIGRIGINFIVDNFGVAKEVRKQTIILSASQTEHIAEFLSGYLQDFPHNTMFYYSEKKHRNRLYDFIKSKEPEVLEFEGKFFTYKLLSENDCEKYKMIEYLAFLIEQGVLIADENTFEFYSENGVYRKSVRLRFTTKEKLEELFIDKFSEEQQLLINEKLRNQQPEAESKKWIIYKDYIFNKQYQKAGKIPNRYKKLLKYCIQYKKKQITATEYSNYYNCTEQTAKEYFSEIHRVLSRSLDIENIRVFKSLKSGKWEVDI